MSSLVLYFQFPFNCDTKCHKKTRIMERLTRNILKHTLPLQKLLLKGVLYRSSRSRMFFEIGALKNFAIFTGKDLCWSLFFSCKYCEIFKNSFFKEHLQWLLFFYKKDVLKNVVKLIGKQLCWSLFFINFQA